MKYGEVHFWANKASSRNWRFHILHLPRPVLLCRLLGHNPVVAGVDIGQRASRWLVCDRCGARDTPDYRVDDDLAVDQAYEFGDDEAAFMENAPRGELGAEVAFGQSFSKLGAHLSIGGSGDNDVLLGLHLWWAHLYLHGAGFGRGLARRLNPHSYDEREIELSILDDPLQLHWEFWTRANATDRDAVRETPRWRSGWQPIDPIYLILGPNRYWWDEVGDRVYADVELDNGEQINVSLQLEHFYRGRTKLGQSAAKHDNWAVDVDVFGGVCTKAINRGHVLGFSVRISADAVEKDAWVEAATIAIRQYVFEQRLSEGWYRRVAMSKSGGSTLTSD